MRNGQSEAVRKSPQGLLDAGTISGVSDGQLLSRFTAHRDDPAEMAFATLVRRHGPMVLRVCQQILGDRHTAEDAFQLTFLILARKAGSIRQPELLGHWLYGVALRTAREARMRDDRRRQRESLRVERIGEEAIDRTGRPERALVRREEFEALHEEVAPARAVSHPDRPLRVGRADVPGGGRTSALPGGHDRRADSSSGNGSAHG